MSFLFTVFVAASAFGYVLLIAWDVARKKWIALFELAGLALFLVFIRKSFGFPSPSVAFGSTGTLAAVVIVYVSLVLGCVSSYFYEARRPFSLRSFLRPLLISPILLMPLMSSIIAKHEIDTLQLFSFALFAFQNGFFWRIVFGRAKKNV